MQKDLDTWSVTHNRYYADARSSSDTPSRQHLHHPRQQNRYRVLKAVLIQLQGVLKGPHPILEWHLRQFSNYGVKVPHTTASATEFDIRVVKSHCQVPNTCDCSMRQGESSGNGRSMTGFAVGGEAATAGLRVAPRPREAVAATRRGH